MGTTRTKEAGTFKITELMIDPATFVRAFIVGNSPFGIVNTFHQYNLDRLERDSISDNLEGYPNLTDLGVKLHSIEEKMPWEVSPFDLYAYYHYEGCDEKPVATPPKYLSMADERMLKIKRGKGLAISLQNPLASFSQHEHTCTQTRRGVSEPGN